MNEFVDEPSTDDGLLSWQPSDCLEASCIIDTLHLPEGTLVGTDGLMSVISV